MEIKTVFHPNGEYYTWMLLKEGSIHHYGDQICYPQKWQAEEAARKKMVELQIEEGP